MASKTEWSNESLPPKKRELLQGSLPLEGAAPPLHGSPGPPSRAAGHGDGGREAQGPAAYADCARNSDAARRGFDFPGDADFCLKRDRASGDLACAYGGGRDGGAAAAAALPPDGWGPLVVAQGLEARREQNFGRGGPGTAEGMGGADPRGNGGRNARAPTAADEGRPSPAQRPLCRGTVLVSAPGATARTLSAPSSVAALGVVTSGPTPRSPPADAADLAGAARVHRRQEARPAGVAGVGYAEPGQDGRGAVRTQLPDVSSCRAVAPAPPPPPPLPPPPPPHLTRGAVIALASGELKRVEELSTEDFVRSARLCASVRVHASRVAAVQPLPGEPGEPAGGRVRLHFCLGERRGQVMLEVQAEHPFFVFGRGWASCEPALSLRLLGLACRQLCVGDMCVSLTTQPSGADDDTEHHHHHQQQQHEEEFQQQQQQQQKHQLQLQQQHKKQHECQLHQQQQQQQLYHQQQHQLQQQQERQLQHQQQQQQERQLQQQQQQQQLQQLQQQNQQQQQQQQQERQLQQQQQQQLQQQQQNQHLQQQQQQHLGWSRRVSLGAWERGHGGDDVPDGHGEGGGRGGLRGGWAVAPPQGNGAQPERRPGDHGARHSVTWQQQEADDDDDEEDDEEDDDVEGLVEAAASCADEVTELSESRKRRRWSAPEGAGVADRGLGPRAVPRHAPHRPGLIPHALKVSIEGRSTAGR